jgi:Flp pilus assembly protein CpaB
VLAVGDSLGGVGGDETETAAAAKAGKKKAPAAKSKNTGVVKGKRTVTLEVELEEAEQISLAAAKGDIVLALRADIDITQIETHGAKVDELVGLEPDEDKPLQTMASRPTRPAKVDGPKAEVVSGGQTVEVEFNSDGTREESGSKKKRR